jgi:hypothetical protein
MLSDRKTALAEQVNLQFGPRDVLTEFLLSADRKARELGLWLTLEDDFSFLLAFNRKQSDSWYPLTPMYDPRINVLGPENAFWIAGRNRAGEIVATQCARLFDWAGTNFKREFESLRLAYAEPDVSAFPEELAVCAAPSGPFISGRVCYSGAAWYRPDFRGTGLSAFLPRLSRAIAHSIWQTDYTISLVEPVLVRKGVVARYGYSNVEDGVEWLNSFRGSLVFSLVWMHSGELLEDLGSWLGEEWRVDFGR